MKNEEIWLENYSKLLVIIGDLFSSGQESSFNLIRTTQSLPHYSLCLGSSAKS
jgi:hypothetical protein